MQTPDWARDAIFYQIFPDRFAKSSRVSKQGLNLEDWDSPPTIHGFKGGDLRGVTEHIDYLQDLGINAIYFTPVFASASNHRYHTYDYHNVDPLLGGNEALRELLDRAHAANIRVVLDGVFNHAGRGFWQFHHTLENGAASPFVDWFYFDPERLAGRAPWGAYPSPEQRLAIQREGSLRAIGYQGWWNMPELPKFNTNTPAVREFIFGVAEYWTDFGIDGWRLDVPGEIDDDSFWQEFRQRVRSCNSQAYIVGELWHDARRWLQGDQFDASMNYPVTAACLGFLPGDHLDLAETLKAGGYQGYVQRMGAAEFGDRIDACLNMYAPKVTSVQLNLLDSHDTPRFLTCASGDINSLRLALTFLLTYPGAPCLFYGDEIGLSGRQDPDCRQPFPWDEGKWNHELRDFTKSLIELRRLHEALRRGGYRRLLARDGTYAFERSLPDETLVVALNASDQLQAIEVTLHAPTAREPRVLSGEARITNDQVLRLEVPGRTGAVVGL
jgi:cyclomaltodextrinase